MSLTTHGSAPFPGMRRAERAVVLVGLAAASLASCAARSVQPATQLTLQVAAERRRCEGEGMRQCLVVRIEPDTVWKNFFDPIDGFEPEASVRYRIRVERTPVARPPADGSAFRYRLLRVLERTPSR